MRRLALPPMSPVNLRAALNYGLAAWFKVMPGHPRGGTRGRYWQNLVGPIDTAAVVDATSLLSHWALGEGGATARDTQGTNNGTYTGTVTRDVLGPSRAAKGITLDGNSANYVLCKSGTIVATLTNSTVEAWFKTTAGAGEKVIYCERAAAGNDIWKLELTAGSLQLTHRDDAGTLTQVNRASSLANGIWYHVAITKSGTTAKLYLDGAQLGADITILGTDTMTNAGIEARIGSDKADGTPTWNGQLAGVAVYNAALSAATIAAHYAGTQRRAFAWTHGDFNWVRNAPPGGFGAVKTNGTGSQKVWNTFGLSTTAFTIALWVWISGTSLSGAFLHIGGNTDGVGLGVGATTFDDVGNDLIGLSGGVVWYDTNTTIGTGWHHVAITQSGGNAQVLYLDGKQAATFANAAMAAPWQAINLGGTLTERYFTGLVDGVRIYTVAKTADQMMRLYQEEKRGNPTTLNWDTRSRMIRAGTPRGGGGKPSGGPGGKNGGKKRILGRRQPGTALMGGM